MSSGYRGDNTAPKHLRTATDEYEPHVKKAFLP